MAKGKHSGTSTPKAAELVDDFARCLGDLESTLLTAKRHGFRVGSHTHYAPKGRHQVTAVRRTFLTLKSAFTSEQFAGARTQLARIEPLIEELSVGLGRPAGEVLEVLRRVQQIVGSDLVSQTQRIDLGASSAKTMSPLETKILDALDRVIPTTALSYKQVLQDLNGQNRFSYRGTAAELREVLRELLDYLAPDSEVLRVVKLNPDQKRPSMKQKATFILKNRGVGDTTRKTAEDSVSAVENSVGSLARSVYDRGSVSTHIAATRTEVLTFKGYAEAVLAELLQIHA